MILAQGEGFHVPDVVDLFTFIPFFTFEVAGVTFRVTYITIIMFALVALLGGLFLAAFRQAQVVPGKLQNLLEASVDAIRENVLIPTIGPGGERWMPFFVSMFFFVFAMNVMGITPGVWFPISSRMGIPVFLAAMSYVIFNVVGIRNQGVVGYFGGIMFPKGVPKPIYIILTPIEVFSTLIVRPLTLAVRLFANMMAGHVMLAIFFLASGYWLYRSDSILLAVLSPFPIALSVAIVAFELFISLIQAFIFTILTAVYIQGAMHPEH
jgi:F-type H+-transporting ATPase subunit a